MRGRLSGCGFMYYITLLLRQHLHNTVYSLPSSFVFFPLLLLFVLNERKKSFQRWPSARVEFCVFLPGPVSSHLPKVSQSMSCPCSGVPVCEFLYGWCVLVLHTGTFYIHVKDLSPEKISAYVDLHEVDTSCPPADLLCCQDIFCSVVAMLITWSICVFCAKVTCEFIVSWTLHQGYKSHGYHWRDR